MLEEYIKETVKKELAKQKLNVVYGKNNQDLEQENEKLKEYIKLLQEDKDVLLKQVSQQIKELRDSKNGLNGANDIIKNIKQENQKLKDKLTIISNLVTSSNTLKETGDLTFFSLMCVINDIENTLKES